MKETKKKVVLGMSGGVDSSVAAVILLQQGYEVVGLFMNNWEETDENGVCASVSDYEDVKRVCDTLKIPYYSVNFSQEYMDRVFSYFLEEYKNGRTPNPDVLCNREIKFGPFLEFAKSLGADYIATGHYAKTITVDNKVKLLKAKDANKDQTYFLNQLSQHQLKDVIFPLGDMIKPDVRKIAEEYNLITATKKDSTGICFIGEKRFREFLKNYIPATKGKIVDSSNEVVGSHDGAMFYTLGQRRGLDIGGKKGGNGERWFVVDKDIKNNLLIVSQGEEDSLYSSGLISGEFNWIYEKPKDTIFECYAKFRYRQEEQKVKVFVQQDNCIKVEFFEKQRAITPGQYVVLYNNFGEELECLGGGVINEIIK